MSNYPKWATTPRQSKLVELFVSSKGFCVFGHSQCQNPDHHYENFIESLIYDWQATDREQRLIDWQLEQKALHQTGERNLPLRGQFSGIAKDIYLDNQPQYYILGFGISGLTLKPFAKVRLASSYWVLWVELEKLTYASLTKSKKRKAIRYHKRIDEIDKAVLLAVKYCLAG